MLRSDIIQAASVILEVVSITKVDDLVRELESKLGGRSGMGKDLTLRAVTTLQSYEAQKVRFGENERELMQVLGLKFLDEASWWASIFALSSDERSDPDGHRYVYQASSEIFLAQRFLPQLVILLRRDGDAAVGVKSETAAHIDYSDNQIRIILSEAGHVYSSPERVVLAIQSIIFMYQAIARILNAAPSDLVMTACDSGSDKTFDFTGLPTAIKELKDLFIQIARLAFFHKERKASERLDLISKGLPLLERVAEMEKTGQIDKAKAELIRREVTKGALGIVDTGATIPELDHSIQYDPKTLLPPRSTLLLPSSHVEEAVEANHHSERGRKGDVDMTKKPAPSSRARKKPRR